MKCAERYPQRFRGHISTRFFFSDTLLYWKHFNYCCEFSVAIDIFCLAEKAHVFYSVFTLKKIISYIQYFWKGDKIFNTLTIFLSSQKQKLDHLSAVA